jgi:Ca2+-binding RTX toxin-like protein
MTTTPTVWLPEFTVNLNNTTGTQTAPYSITLMDGRILTVWTDDANSVSSSPGEDLIAQIHLADGTPAGSPFQLNVTNVAFDEDDASIVALRDGGFVVFYESQGTADSDSSAVRFNRYNSSGVHVKSGTVSSGTVGGIQHSNPSATLLADGRVAVTYESKIAGEASNVFTKILDFTNTTATIGAALNSSANSAAAERNAETDALSDGNLVTVYQRGPSSVEFKIIDTAGNAIGVPTNLAAAGSGANVSGLTGGGFVAVWLEGGAVVAEIRDNAGAVNTAKFEVSGAANTPSGADVVALADGGFFVVWKDGAANKLVGQRMDANGTLVGSEVDIADGASISDASVSLSGDGRILVAFVNGAGEISQVVLDPRDSGPIQGSELRDMIAARIEGGTIDGLGGNDTIYGSDVDDSISGGSGLDWLTGYDGNDTILGGSNGDTLNGGAGADNLQGGDGGDTFIFAAGDDSGSDTVSGGTGTDQLLAVSSVDFSSTLVTSIEGIAFSDTVAGAKTVTIQSTQLGNGLLGALAVDGGKNATDTLKIEMGSKTSLNLQVLTFQEFTGKDKVLIVGDANNENIIGSSAKDLVRAGAGDDTISGAGGKDKLFGGAGNDIYFVNKLGEAVEKAGEGIDSVNSSGSYKLGANIENLQLLGSGNTFATGNDLVNVIGGNSGNNVINGKDGNDILTGNDGADKFRFDTALNAATNVDQVTDFDVGLDKIQIDNDVFTGLTRGNLAGTNFHIGANAADANDRIIYNKNTGDLFFDADGNGAGAKVKFAELDTGLALTASHFIVV